MDMRQLGERIRSRREKLSLRQADVAAALRVSAQAVSKWERGENAPDLAAVPGLTRLLGVSIEWLLGETAPATDTFAATVFCTSLNGFAQRSATMPPREVAAWANRIYYLITESVLRFDGVPVKCVGDGFLGFFAGAGQAQRALQAARMAQGGLASDGVVIVLHSGEIYLGALGHPGYEQKDIIGAAVNTAFLCMPWVAGRCRSGIGLTQTAARQLDDQASLRRAGKVKVKGGGPPVTIYEPGNSIHHKGHEEHKGHKGKKKKTEIG
jgi:class 3 adenylate cyclase